ncbi:hypothetical protein NDI44_25805 [Trichocoleus sp. DQ-A3]|nr:hypothetical protein [Coleofasciculus sp. FACHB-125]
MPPTTLYMAIRGMTLFMRKPGKTTSMAGTATIAFTVKPGRTRYWVVLATTI